MLLTHQLWRFVEFHPRTAERVAMDHLEAAQHQAVMQMGIEMRRLGFPPVKAGEAVTLEEGALMGTQQCVLGLAPHSVVIPQPALEFLGPGGVPGCPELRC